MTKMQQRLAAAKAKAQSEQKEPSTQLSEEDRKALEMGYAYEAMLGKYLHRPALRYFVRFDSRRMEPKTRTFFLKAAVLADQHKVDYPTYVRAQFYWFDLWFHRAPKIYELAGQRGKFPATLRLTQYLELNRQGKIGKDISSPVMPKKHNQALDPQIVDKINRQRLNQLCSVYQLSEEQCLEQFAPAGLFDLEWLKKIGHELQREKGS